LIDCFWMDGLVNNVDTGRSFGQMDGQVKRLLLADR
jgi:hypothetical protein